MTVVFKETQSHDVAADAAHRDAVADAECHRAGSMK